MKKLSPGDRGFTLIEILLVMLITAIVLFMVSQLTSQTFGTLRFLQQKSQTLQAASLGLDRLASELREAVDVRLATASVEFDKVNFAAPICVGNNVIDPATNWDRDYAVINQIGTVRYFAAGDILNRRVQFGGTQTAAVATRVNDFQVARAPLLNSLTTRNNVFLITLTIDEDRKLSTFETVVTVPGEAP